MWVKVTLTPAKLLVALKVNTKPTLGRFTVGGAQATVAVIVGVPVIPVIVREVSRGFPVTGLLIGGGSRLAIPSSEAVPLTISLLVNVIRKLST